MREWKVLRRSYCISASAHTTKLSYFMALPLVLNRKQLFIVYIFQQKTFSLRCLFTVTLKFAAIGFFSRNPVNWNKHPFVQMGSVSHTIVITVFASESEIG